MCCCFVYRWICNRKQPQQAFAYNKHTIRNRVVAGLFIVWLPEAFRVLKTRVARELGPHHPRRRIVSHVDETKIYTHMATTQRNHKSRISHHSLHHNMQTQRNRNELCDCSDSRIQFGRLSVHCARVCTHVSVWMMFSEWRCVRVCRAYRYSTLLNANSARWRRPEINSKISTICFYPTFKYK